MDYTWRKLLSSIQSHSRTHTPSKCPTYSVKNVGSGLEFWNLTGLNHPEWKKCCYLWFFWIRIRYSENSRPGSGFSNQVLCTLSAPCWTVSFQKDWLIMKIYCTMYNVYWIQLNWIGLYWNAHRIQSNKKNSMR